MTDKKTEYITITGHIAWAKVYEPDTGFGKTEWSIDVFPLDDAEWAKFKAAGIQKTVKENTNPDKNVPVGKYFRTTRSEHKLVKNQVIYWVGPTILDMDGNVIVDYINTSTGKRAWSYNASEKTQIERRGRPIVIGNGSKCEVTIAVFDTLKGKGQRLERVKVLDLIELDQSLPPLSPLVAVRQREVQGDTQQEW